MEMTDTEKREIKDEVLGYLLAAHEIMFTHTKALHGRWAVVAREIAKAGKMLDNRSGANFANTPQRIRAKKAQAKMEKSKQVKKPTAKPKTFGTPQEELYNKAKGMNLRVRSTMKVETLQKLIDEAS